ncbi:MAG TPA: CoA transferase [Acidimicrobiales bacterium]|nr:CoA transferase [Acidimicrobiales bacterium]
MADGLLAGVRVVEGSAFVAAPSGGMTLAQLGADVIRFDQIGGGLDYRRWPLTDAGASLYWAGLNKGKRSLAVDLRSPRGRELLTELIVAPGPDHGVFLTNFPASGWMAYDRLRDRRGDLIMLNVLGNHDGTTALDYTVNCAVGYPLVTGPADMTEPINHVLPAWDFLCGQQAALGVVAALRHRDRTGTGQLMTLALSDVALWAVSALGHIAEAQINGSARPRIGNDVYGAFGRDFATGDGRRVIAVAVTMSQWKSLLDATRLGDEVRAIETRRGLDFAIEGDRYLACDELNPLFASWCAARSLAEIRDAFDARGVCWGPYQSFMQLVSDDDRCSTDNPLFSSIEQTGIGTILAAAHPLDPAMGRISAAAAPSLGQHTDEILADVLGLSATEIARLHDDAIVA